jgi:hypothetical protein
MTQRRTSKLHRAIELGLEDETPVMQIPIGIREGKVPVTVEEQLLSKQRLLDSPHCPHVDGGGHVQILQVF